MKRVIVITSGKGGVGKTTTAINLGAAINHFGRDVLIVDGNLTTPNVGIHFGSPEVPVNLNHVLSGLRARLRRKNNSLFSFNKRTEKNQARKVKRFQKRFH